MRRLSLFIPGLFSHPVPSTETFTPQTPRLDRLLRFGKSDDVLSDSFVSTLFQLFGLNVPKQNLPVAAVTRLIDEPHDTKGLWMRADPVHLRAEREAVILFDNTMFKLSKHDALILAAEAQQVFAEHGISLEVPTSDRWYLKLTSLPTISATPIHEVVSKDIHMHLPGGEDKTRWNQLMNELQMTMHHCELNRRREQRGELPINGLWLWGAGELPITPMHVWSNVFADDITTRALSKLTDSPCQKLPDAVGSLIMESTPEDNLLVVIASGLQYRQYYNFEGWNSFIAYLEEKWFADIEDLFAQKELAELQLFSDTRRYTITKNSFMKFWRHFKSLHRNTHDL